MQNNKANAYKKTHISTANRGQLLLMLYEAAIRNLKKANEALDQNNIALKGQMIGKTHDIINELLNSLDFSVGGNIARDLERLYNFMTEQLVQANMENSKEKITVVCNLLSTLLEGWQGAVQNVNQPNATGPKKGE